MNKGEKEKLLIIGASGHGKVVADIALKMNKWQCIAFLDDDENLVQSLGLQVIGKPKDINLYIGDWDIFVAIGNNSIREQIHLKLENANANIPILIHPAATIGLDVELSKGTVVMAGAIINCSSKIGKGSIINTGATIDHDNLIGNFVHISPGVHLAGNVNVSSNCWLGIGSIVRNNITLYQNSQIGAGAVIVKDTEEPGIYIGVPARRVTNGKNSNFSKQ